MYKKDKLLKLQEDKSKILTKINFLLEDLQEVSDVEIRKSTNALLEKLRVQLKNIDEKLEKTMKEKNDSIQNENEDDIIEDDINKEKNDSIQNENEEISVPEEIEEEASRDNLGNFQNFDDLEDFRDFEKKEDFNIEQELEKLKKKYEVTDNIQEESQASEYREPVSEEQSYNEEPTEEEQVQYEESENEGQNYNEESIEKEQVQYEESANEEQNYNEEPIEKEQVQYEESANEEQNYNEEPTGEEQAQYEESANEEQEEELGGYDADEELRKLGQKYNVKVEEETPEFIDYDTSDTDNPKVYIGRKDNGDILAMYNKKK